MSYLPIEVILEAKDGTNLSPAEIRIKCSKCGAINCPLKPELVKTILNKGFLAGLQCFKCKTILLFFVNRENIPYVPIDVILEAKDGTNLSPAEIRIKCPKCGAINCPLKPELVKTESDKGLLVGLRCFKCEDIIIVR